MTDINEMNWDDVLTAAHGWVRAGGPLVIAACRWIDEHYSDAAVRARQQQAQSDDPARPEAPGFASANAIAGTAEGQDSSLWRLNALAYDLQQGERPWPGSIEDPRALAARRLVLVALASDRDAHEYLADLTELGRVPWVEESAWVHCRVACELRDEIREGGQEVQRFVRDALRAVLDLSGRPIEPAAEEDEDSTDRPRTRIAKPGGWTKSELIDEAREQTGTHYPSGATFDRIRTAARLPSPPSGGRGQQHRYSRADVRRMAKAAAGGPRKFRFGSDIKTAWLGLIGD